MTNETGGDHPLTPPGYDPKLAPRYTDIATFMRCPLVRDATGIEIALAGIPFDGGLTNRTGARHGPREIRNQSSLMRSIHHVTKVDPYALCTIADVGDVPFTDVFHLEPAIAEIADFFGRLHAAGAVPLSAGGDHSVTFPVLQAIAAERPLGLVHIDAHTDTWDYFLGSKYHHGSPFRRATEDGLIDPKRTIQIGIRGAQNTSEGWDYSLDHGMRVVFIEEFETLGVDGVIAEARRVIGDGPAYISFDVDGLDPVYTPGTGTPEAGGITTREAQALLRGLRGMDLYGGDVVEVAPPLDPTGNTALVGATIMYEILCLLAESVAARKGTA